MSSLHPSLGDLRGFTVNPHLWIIMLLDKVNPPGLHQPGAYPFLPITASSIGYFPGHGAGFAMAIPKTQRKEKVVKVNDR